MKALQARLTYANVTATLALFIAVGGASAFAATQLGKNTVGSKQLKKNAVITAKIKNQAVTAAKIRNGTLTGAQIDASTLGTVPSAQTATTSKSAQAAQSAQIAAALGPSEPWHLVGAPGEPAFAAGWYSVGTSYGEVAFYKDQTGTVHLRGPAAGGSGSGGEVIFSLPPGFRPDPSRYLAFPVLCSCDGRLEIAGSDGAISVNAATIVHLEGITFKAES